MRRAPALLLFSLVLAGAAWAEDRGRPVPAELGRRPIEVSADRLVADSGSDRVTFDGNVVARQEDVVLYADRLFAEYSRASRAIEKITAEGNVRVVQGAREARAARAVFHNLDQRIVLSGGSELVEGKNVLRGETVTIWLRENRSEVRGGEGGRVKAVLHPSGTGAGGGEGGR